ncbi:MAG: hypothetical protein LBB81_09515 [Treponema sp.]|jgi:hypothetical protein|nr:hypothetical protein [Treponema sp.]
MKTGRNIPDISKIKNKPVCSLLLFLIFLSCATNPQAYRDIDNAVEKTNFTSAVTELENKQKSKPPLYPEKNLIMYYLDKGLLEHYAGNNAASSKDLQEAERLIEEAYTKSITLGLLSYIVNDNTREYPGEDFEDIYLNVFNALNYYNAGNPEGALVEIRKLSNSSGKLTMLSQKYEYKDPKTGESLEQAAAREAGTKAGLPSAARSEFTNSALARYLGALFYQAGGNADSARIEFEQIPEAFASNRNIYSNSLPEAVFQARDAPSDKGRLNVISFTGLSPVKTEERIHYYFPLFQVSVLSVSTFKLPKMTRRPSSINRIEVIVGDQGRFEMELLEDIGSVVIDTFAVRYSNIVIKTYIRTILKHIAADIGGMETARRGNTLAGVLTAFAARLAFEATESADTRMSRYFPDKAYIGGINLDPGFYNVTINYYSGDILLYNDIRDNVEVKLHGLNLIETVNLK